MIALAAARKSPGAARGGEAVHHGAELAWRRAARRSRRSRRGKSRPACSRAALAAISAVSLVAARPLLPVKALALPELTTSARALPRLELRAAPVDRRRRAFRAGEHAGDGGAGVEQRQQHVGAVRRSGCRPRRSRAARRRSPACRGRVAGRGGRRRWSWRCVIAGLVPAHPRLAECRYLETWMAGDKRRA